MSNINEAYQSLFEFRSVFENEKKVKTFTSFNKIETETELSFDREKADISSIDQFASSFLSSILFSIYRFCKNKELDLQDLEGKIKITLDNPLTYLNVYGYKDEPKISAIEGKIYFYIDAENEEEAKRIFDLALNLSPIYNTLKSAIKINLKPVLIL